MCCPIDCELYCPDGPGGASGSPCPHRRRGDLRRVLIADDDADTRAWLEIACRDLPFEVVFAANGVTAQKCIEAARADGHPFNLLVLDVVMPHKSGLAVAEEVRASGDTTTPIVFLTGEDSPLVDMRAHSVEAVDVWIKGEITAEGIVREIQSLVA